MHETTPQIFLIARPSIAVDGMRGYLADVGGESWLDRRLEESAGDPNAGETDSHYSRYFRESSAHANIPGAEDLKLMIARTLLLFCH